MRPPRYVTGNGLEITRRDGRFAFATIGIGLRHATVTEAELCREIRRLTNDSRLSLVEAGPGQGADEEETS